MITERLTLTELRGSPALSKVEQQVDKIFFLVHILMRVRTLNQRQLYILEEAQESGRLCPDLIRRSPQLSVGGRRPRQSEPHIRGARSCELAPF